MLEKNKYCFKWKWNNNYIWCWDILCLARRKRNILFLLHTKEWAHKNSWILFRKRNGNKFCNCNKSFFSEGIDYSGLEKIEGVVKLSDVNEIMKLHIGESYYSIMNPQKLKINLEEKGSNKYNIYLLGPNGECEYIEENEEAPFVFERFYNEAVYLKVILERVRGYEAIFEDTLSEKEIYDIIK